MTKKAIDARKRRDRLHAKGLCIWCGKRQARPGLKECEVCAKKRRESQKRYLATMPREKYDERLERASAATMKKYYKRKKDGVCVKCGETKVNGETVCPECKKKIKEQYHRRKEYVTG